MVSWPGVLTWLKVKAIPGGGARLILGVQGLLATYAIVGGLLLSLFRVTQQLPRQLTYSLFERIIFIGVPTTVAAIGGYPVQAMIWMAALLGLIIVVEVRE